MIDFHLFIHDNIFMSVKKVKNTIIELSQKHKKKKKNTKAKPKRTVKTLN